jgi:cathepsin D
MAGYDSGGDQCIGSIFDLGQVTSAAGGDGNPNWIIGDTFLVRNHGPPPK